MSEFGFLNYSTLWCLLPILVALTLKRLELVRTLRLKLLGIATVRTGRILLPISFISLLILSLFRPYLGFSEAERKISAHDVFLIIDVSRSMLAKDVAPDRLTLAKRKVQDLVTLFTQRKLPTRIAILLFSGSAYQYCPLTSDLAVVQTYLSSVSPDLITKNGTGLNQAVQVLQRSILDAKAKEPYILMLSDGEDLNLDIPQALAQLKESNLALNTLGIGTPEGQPIELPTGQFIKDASGQIVLSKLDEENLKALAEGSGGKYVNFSLGDDDLESLLATEWAGKGETSGKSEKIRIYNELGPLVLIFALSCTILMALFGRLELIFCLAPLFILYDAQAQDGYSAAKAFESNDFQAAESRFQSALKSDPENAALLQGLGSSQYKLGKFSEAEKTFSKLAEAKSSATRRYEALHDLGNAHFMLKDYKAAIDAYQKALSIKSDDRETTHNLELAKQLLEQQQQQQQQQQQESQSSSNESQSSSSESSEDQSSAESQSNSGNSQSSSSAGSASSSESSNSGGQESSRSMSAENQLNSQKSREALEHERTDKLPESEAKAWLDSLDDSPLLLRKDDRDRRNDQGQTW